MTANPTPDPKPNQKLVRVLDTEQASEALVIQGLLESAGIDSKMSGIDTVQEVLPFGGTIILVREEDAEKARQLIEEYRRAPGEELSDAFTDDGQGGAQ